MTILRTVQGDIMAAPENYIAHQTNGCTVYPYGLAKTIAQRFPWADVYGQREKEPGKKNCAVSASRDPPGTVKVVQDPTNSDPKGVICMFAQWAPGKPGHYASAYPSDYTDTLANRVEWFQTCLDKIDDLNLCEPIAMPHSVGCGLAGGDWDTYRAMIESAQTEVVLYEWGLPTSGRNKHK